MDPAAELIAMCWLPGCALCDRTPSGRVSPTLAVGETKIAQSPDSGGGCTRDRVAEVESG